MPDGRTVGYAYTNGRLTSATDPAGKTTSYTYDAGGRLATIVDPNNHTAVRNVYGGDGRVIEQYDALNNKTSFAWDATNQIATATDARGNAWKHDYDNNVLAKQIDALNNITQLGHDSSLNNTSVASPTGQTTTMSYDSRGNLLTATAPASLGSVQKTFVYNTRNDVTQVTDARGKVTTYGYDANGNNTTVVQDGQTVATNAYNANGQLTSATDGANRTTTYTYDASGNLASETDALGNKTTYGYDAAGRRTSMVEPRGNVQGADPNLYRTSYTYDAAGRLLTETDPLGNTTTYTYDAVGNRTSVLDARNNTTSYAYDGLNRLQSVTAPGGAATTYAYDGAGNLLSRTHPNNHTSTYGYDTANRMVSKTLPLNRVWTYSYDAASNLTQTVDANGNATQTAGDGTTTQTWDRTGRLTGIDYSGTTPDVTFSYDAVGNRTQMVDGAGAQTYTYDSVNRLKTVIRGSDTFSYDYDLAGNVTRRTYPDGTVTDYTYDADSRMATVASGGATTTYAYDAVDNVTSTTLPASNGHVEERTYDRAGRLTRVRSVRGADTLVDFTYTLDAVGSPTQVVRAGSTPGTMTYAYDNRDRLTEVCFQASCPGGGDPFIRWTYDGVGNRLNEARPSGTTSYTYNAADELTQAGSITYSYDQNGNEIAAGTTTLSYDLANRLKTYVASGTTTTYSYDGDGVRLSAATISSATHFLSDTSHGLPQLALERDSNGTLIRRYVYGRRRISMSAGATSYYHYDNLGSVANVTSSSGTKQWTYDYDPFGAARSESQDDSNAPPNPMLFTGEVRDASGLYYFRARQYEPTTARFTAADPIASPGVADDRPQTSAYAYVDQRPTALVDPSGLIGVPSSEGQDRPLLAASPEAQGAGYVEIDYPHFSRTGYLRGTHEFLVKARWIKIRGRASYARLTVKLQWSPNHGGWLNMGHPRIQTVPPGANVPAAAHCRPGIQRTLRGAVDFDVVGYPDPSGWLYGPVRTVRCQP